MKKCVLAFILAAAAIITALPFTSAAYPAGVSLVVSDGRTAIVKKLLRKPVDIYDYNVYSYHIGKKDGTALSAGYDGIMYASSIDGYNGRISSSNMNLSNSGYENFGKPSGKDKIAVALTIKHLGAEGDFGEEHSVQLLDMSGKVLASYDSILDSGNGLGYIVFRKGEYYYPWTVAGKYLSKTKDLTKVSKTVKRNLNLEYGDGTFKNGILLYPVYAAADTVV